LKSNDIAAGDLVPVEVDGLAILVAADLDGKIFAIANSCPHLGTPLENGRLELVPLSTLFSYIVVFTDSEKALQLFAHFTKVLLALNQVSALTPSPPHCFLIKNITAGDVVGDWCPFPPILGPLVLGNLAPPEKVSTFPVRSKGQNIEVFIDRNLKERFESKYWSGLLDAKGKATGDYY
jgi:nitrite reductase/ring-hydroxylating ferredoxin subunit